MLAGVLMTAYDKDWECAGRMNDRLRDTEMGFLLHF